MSWSLEFTHFLAWLGWLAKKTRQPPAVFGIMKAKARLANFIGKVFTRFSKPSRKFIEKCIYGIQASGDTKLSSIVRVIDDDTRLIYTEKRLSRNLDDEALENHIPKRTSAFIHAGAAHFRTQKMGKLQAKVSSLYREFWGNRQCGGARRELCDILPRFAYGEVWWPSHRVFIDCSLFCK